MFEQFKEWIKPFNERMENLLKFGSISKIIGANGKLQEVQIKSIRNIEDVLRVGSFGINSKAPLGSRGVIVKIGNQKILIAEEHIESIIDITPGDTVIYNQSGHTIKIKGDDITIKAPNIIYDCDNYTINANTKFTINAPIAEINAVTNITNNANFTGASVLHNGTTIGADHKHSQGSDSNGDSQVNVSTPIS